MSLDLASFPPQMRAVVELRVQGLTLREIAERLSLAPSTVSAHLRRAHLRTGTGRVGELVARNENVLRVPSVITDLQQQYICRQLLMGVAPLEIAGRLSVSRSSVWLSMRRIAETLGVRCHHVHIVRALAAAARAEEGGAP